MTSMMLRKMKVIIGDNIAKIIVIIDQDEDTRTEVTHHLMTAMLMIDIIILINAVINDIIVRQELIVTDGESKKTK